MTTLPSSFQRNLAALFILTLAIKVAAHDLTNIFLKGPYLQAPGAKTMTVIWESPTNKQGLVRYGLNARLDQQLRLETPRELLLITTNTVTDVSAGKTNISRSFRTNRVFLYEATLANLRPNSVYAYSAETEGARTPPKSFRTFGSQARKATFIAYGDTRTNPKTHAALAANFRRHSPDFILHTGDLVAAGRRYDLWGKEFFAPLADVIDEIPMLTAIGNHEEDGLNYLHYLHLPGKERWYSYDVGPVHVLALDYHHEKEKDEQFAFAKHDLNASRAPWKVVIVHYPVFNIGGHGTGWGHDLYLPLFHQTKVDLLLTGHSHIYERFRPVATKEGSEAWPITHITTGGGGAPLYATYPHPALAVSAATNHYIVIEATPAKLKGRAYTTNDAVIDSFELTKPGGRPAGKYLAQIYPEGPLKFSFDAAPLLAGAVASLPTTNSSSANVRFTLRPTKTMPQPVELEVSLTPSAAAYYELIGGPLRLSIPSATESNQVVWASVRATGARRISAFGRGRDKELVPALTFQAKAVAESVETLVYGPKCKTSQPAAEEAKKLAEASPSK